MDYSVEEMAFISSYNIGEFMAPQGEESGSEAPATEVEGQRRRKDVGDDEERHIPDTHIQPPPENGGSGTGSLSPLAQNIHCRLNCHRRRWRHRHHHRRHRRFHHHMRHRKPNQ
ncbi:unnamed protein product [Cuscuta europaea]|uniref:Uncharacterized protein n=1 Tax=Cuscuta europaea TaxID=41803 RepID=A0A9P1EJD4_CUSEU|nr:unnamed protein product [Cuscuta europaea]